MFVERVPRHLIGHVIQNYLYCCENFLLFYLGAFLEISIPDLSHKRALVNWNESWNGNEVVAEVQHENEIQNENKIQNEDQNNEGEYDSSETESGVEMNYADTDDPDTHIDDPDTHTDDPDTHTDV